jgi:hypothetical protein
MLAGCLIVSSGYGGEKKNKKADPDEIGNRDVGKGVNFYSLEKEIALGKQMAQEVERQAKLIEDPVIAEYVCIRRGMTPPLSSISSRRLRLWRRRSPARCRGCSLRTR